MKKTHRSGKFRLHFRCGSFLPAASVPKPVKAEKNGRSRDAEGDDHVTMRAVPYEGQNQYRTPQGKEHPSHFSLDGPEIVLLRRRLHRMDQACSGFTSGRSRAEVSRPLSRSKCCSGFADISAHTQIIAVSHLAQIVAMADRNFYISKSETPEGKTVTSIAPLSAEDSRKEIIRLLGGEAGSDAAQGLAS